jgi:hypothetical protein
MMAYNAKNYAAAEREIKDDYKKITGKQFNSRTADISTHSRGGYTVMTVENCQILTSLGASITIVVE